MMKQFEFSIIASGLDPEAEDFESRFYDGACNDATVSFQKGYTILDFAREASDFESAIDSAVRDVMHAGAAVRRIEPDSLVSLADIAKRTGLTRAAISNYWHGERRSVGFPNPVWRVTTNSPLWDWTTVAEWLLREGKLHEDAVVEARIIKHKNLEIKEKSDEDCQRECA